jgi:neuroligin
VPQRDLLRVCSISSHLLTVPFSSTGLFHRVVLSSGSALSPWASVHDPNDLRTKIGEQTGCSTEGDEDIADCLRGVPLKSLMDVQLPEIR